MRQAYALLPHVKVTDLLLEVDRWTGFTDDFTHLKHHEPATDRPLLLTVILADAINLGLHKPCRAGRGRVAAGSRSAPRFQCQRETYAARSRADRFRETAVANPASGDLAHLSPLGWEHTI